MFLEFQEAMTSQLPKASEDPRSLEPKESDSLESLEAFDPFALELFLSFVEALFSCTWH